MPPGALDRFLVYKGSIAIDGISLTIASIEDGLLRVAIIPHTYEVTNLAAHKPGDRLNIECDILAKYVQKLLPANIDVTQPEFRPSMIGLREFIRRGLMKNMKITATGCLLVFLCSGIGLAQSTAGSGAVGGTVRDNNGIGLPDTDVIITNQSLALNRSAGTSDEGIFHAPGLVAAPGYKLKIARKGFQPWESAEFTGSGGPDG